MMVCYSLVSRPSLTAFFAAVEKSVPTLFSTAAKKAVREGLGTRLGLLLEPDGSNFFSFREKN